MDIGQKTFGAELRWRRTCIWSSASKVCHIWYRNWTSGT